MLRTGAYNDDADVRVGLGGCFLEGGKQLPGEDEGADDAAKHKLEK